MDEQADAAHALDPRRPRRSPSGWRRRALRIMKTESAARRHVDEDEPPSGLEPGAAPASRTERRRPDRLERDHHRREDQHEEASPFIGKRDRDSRSRRHRHDDGSEAWSRARRQAVTRHGTGDAGAEGVQARPARYVRPASPTRAAAAGGHPPRGGRGRHHEGDRRGGTGMRRDAGKKDGVEVLPRPAPARARSTAVIARPPAHGAGAAQRVGTSRTSSTIESAAP